MPWKGYYKQGGTQHQMQLQQFKGNPVPGGMVEGKGYDQVGNFTFNGQFNAEQPLVRFKKQYTGPTHFHAIYYQGKLFPDRSGFEGHWGFNPGQKQNAFKMWYQK